MTDTVNVPREAIDGLSALERDLIKCFNPHSEWGLFTYLFFYGFEDELEGAYPNEVMKAGVRLLAAKGVLEFKRGLRNEEGGVAGAGYGLTDLGRQTYAALAAAPKAEPVKEVIPGFNDVKEALESGGRVIEYFEAQRRMAAYKALRGTEADKVAVTYIDAAISALRAQTEAPKVEQEPLRDVLFNALNDYTLTNMGCEDDPHIGYPLVDLVSNEGTDISTGKAELRVLADHLAEVLYTHPAPASDELLQSGEVLIEHEPCPKCQSVNVAPYWWHTGQAWIIVCQDCRHEKGRESEEHKAWRVWDEAAKHKGPQS
jgi:hypothetical protein